MNLQEPVYSRIAYLQRITTEKERALLKVPEGMVKGNRHGEGWQYYYRKNPGEKNGIYIKKKDIALAKVLAQKEYDKKILQKAQAELRVLQEIGRLYEKGCVETVYDRLPPSHHPLVVPVEIPLARFVEEWQKMTFQGKTIGEKSYDFYTNRGEHVRSKSEGLIANLLEYHHVPYHYEKPLFLNGYGTVYPDFTLLDVRNRQEVYWEHMGLLDDSEYREKALNKITTYMLNGYMPGQRLILTYETGKQPINMKVIERIVKQYVYI